MKILLIQKNSEYLRRFFVRSEFFSIRLRKLLAIEDLFLIEDKFIKLINLEYKYSLFLRIFNNI